LLLDSLLEKTPIKRPSTDYLLENIEKVIPDNYHSNSILKPLIKKYSKKGKKNNPDNDSSRVNELIKTIQFPNKKKKRILLDSELTSFLPSPSYSRSISHRTSNDKNMLNDKEKIKLKP
jgi:hypothetical protein